MLASRRFMGLSLGGARRVRRRAFWLVSSPRRAALQLRDSTGIKRTSPARRVCGSCAVYPPRPAAFPNPSAPALVSPTLNHAREAAALDRAGGRHVLRLRRHPLHRRGHHRLARRVGLPGPLLRLCHRPQRLAHPLQPEPPHRAHDRHRQVRPETVGQILLRRPQRSLHRLARHHATGCGALSLVKYAHHTPTGMRNRPDRFLLLLLPNLQRKRLSFTSSSHPIRPRPARRHNGRTTTSDTPSEPNQEACSPGCASSRCSSPITRYASHSQPRSSSSPSSRRTHATCCAQPATHHAWGMSTKERSDPRPPPSARV